MKRLEIVTIVTIICALIVIGIDVHSRITRSNQKPVSAPPLAVAGTMPAKACDQPAETYLINAQRSLHYLSESTTAPQMTSSATSASAWIQMYQICSQLQKESARKKRRLSRGKKRNMDANTDGTIGMVRASSQDPFSRSSCRVDRNTYTDDFRF